MKLETFRLERFFDRYEFKVRYLLCSSDCESLSITDLLAYEPDAVQRFAEHWLGYTEYRGAPELREAIASLYTAVTADNTLVCAGAEEAIFVFMNTALNSGDHVIVHAPGYQSLYEIARAIGCEVELWQTRDDQGWALDMDWLRDHLRPNTRAIVVNCPHNPTGYLMTIQEQKALVEMARARGILLFSDEVYRGLEHDSGARLPAACDLYENAVSLGVMSKTYGLAGLRIGWLVTRNQTLLDRLTAFKDYVSMCNSAPSEFLAALALRHQESIVARNLFIIQENLSVLDRFFEIHADRFAWQKPKAGSIAFPRLRDRQGSLAFCTDLVEKRGVLLAPSAYFDHGDAHFRIGFGRRNLPQAVAALDEYLHTT